MSKWLSMLVAVLLCSLALRAEAATYTVKATVVQQDQVMQMLVSTFGTKPLPKADFEKKVAELWDRTITISLATEQRAALKRDTKVTATSTTMRMDNVLDATKFLSSAIVKDGLYQIPPLGGIFWKTYVEQCPCIHVDYEPVKP
jgi:hypothetical protein